MMFDEIAKVLNTATVVFDVEDELRVLAVKLHGQDQWVLADLRVRTCVMLDEVDRALLARAKDDKQQRRETFYWLRRIARRAAA